MNIKKSQNVSRDVPVFVTPEMKAKGVFDLVHPNVQRDIPVVVTPEMQAAGVSAYPSGNNVQPAYQNNTAPANNNLPTNNIQTSAPSSSLEDFLKTHLNEAYSNAGGQYLNNTYNFSWMNSNQDQIKNKIDLLQLSYRSKENIKNYLNEVIKKRSTSNNMLEKLVKMANLLDDIGFNVESDELTKIAIKLAKKKKNVPNNPSLWASCKAWAKSTFDVYPCVPLDSLALTKKGWAEYSDLNIGDEILTYSQSKDKLEWKPVVNLHFHEDAPTLSLKKLQTNFKVRCTPDHKWVLKTPNVKYPDNLVEAKNITKRMNLKTAAEIVDDVNENLDLSNWRKGDDWVENILKMSKSQLEAFFASGIVYDGHDKGLSSLNRSTYGFSQKNINHGEAMEIAAVLLGYRVSFVQKMHNTEMKSWTFIKRDSESTGNLIIEEDLNCDVWCPETENNTWVMKQGKIITITGNSAYANGAAAKRYKSKGGTWRKSE
jgi:hypothetical protein